MLNLAPRLHDLTTRVSVSPAALTQALSRSAGKLGAVILARLQVTRGRRRTMNKRRSANVLPGFHRASQNLCEFDYDYYVALEAHRQAQPSRLNRVHPSRARTV